MKRDIARNFAVDAYLHAMHAWRIGHQQGLACHCKDSLPAGGVVLPNLRRDLEGSCLADGLELRVEDLHRDATELSNLCFVIAKLEPNGIAN